MTNEILSFDAVKHEELKILVEFHDFCEKYNLCYSLSYGTLIGAVRHKGFIPWDDDIDVVMPRKDYDKFLGLVQSGRFSPWLRVQATEIDGYLPSFAKVINPMISVRTERDRPSVPEWLWIDVFPIDGISDSNLKATIMFYEVKLLDLICIVSRLNFHYPHPISMKILMAMFFPISLVLPIEKWASERLHKLSRKYVIGETKRAGQIGWGFGLREAFPNSYFTDVMDAEFEGHQFKIPTHYDEMLTQLYGDYMIIPPADKQVSHQLTASVNSRTE